MNPSSKRQLQLGALLFGLAFAGILSALPLIPRLVAAQTEKPPISTPVLQLISTLQSSAVVAGLIALGMVFAPKTNLGAPVLTALAQREDAWPQLKGVLVPSMAWGIAGGMLLHFFSAAALDHLPAEFLSAAESFAPPWYTRLLYGGITEEVMIRWGLMPLLVFLSFQITQRSGETLRPRNYVIGATLSALLFGAGHLPVASLLSPELTLSIIAYVVLGNATFGILAGLLFWRKGLESAIIAHITAHLTLLAMAGLVG